MRYGWEGKSRRGRVAYVALVTDNSGIHSHLQAHGLGKGDVRLHPYTFPQLYIFSV